METKLLVLFVVIGIFFMIFFRRRKTKVINVKQQYPITTQPVQFPVKFPVQAPVQPDQNNTQLMNPQINEIVVKSDQQNQFVGSTGSAESTRPVVVAEANFIKSISKMITAPENNNVNTSTNMKTVPDNIIRINGEDFDFSQTEDESIVTEIFKNKVPDGVDSVETKFAPINENKNNEIMSFNLLKSFTENNLNVNTMLNGSSKIFEEKVLETSDDFPIPENSFVEYVSIL